MPALPSEIGGYQIQRVLGTGGMATVYAALQRQPRRTVAVKVMRGAANAQTAMHRFKREIEILGRLRHPYIAQVYDAGVHEDHGNSVPYFVMEYVPGAKTIVEFAETRELSLRDRLKLFVKVCAAVEHGHAHKIIHRDLKPGNILIDESADPKIIDFGVARAVEIDISSATMQTEAGRLIGTVQYMAPEQLDTSRQDLDARCDVYALGVLLYKLLTGRAPHDLTGLPVFTAAQVIREDVPPRPSSINPELKGDLETILLRALAKDRTRRYRTAGAFGRDLVRFLASKPIKAREAGWLYRARLFARRHPSEVRAAAIVAIVIGLAAAIIFWQRSAPGPVTPTTPAAGVASAAPPIAPAAPPAPADASPADSRRAATPEVKIPDAFGLPGAGAAATAIGFVPLGRTIVAATADGSLVWWDIDLEEAELRTTDHDAPIRHLAFSADGTRVASAAEDGSVALVERRADGSRLVLSHSFPGVLCLALSPDGTNLAQGCPDLTLRVITADGIERHRLRGTRGAFHAVAFSADGTLLAAGSERGGIEIWETISGDRAARVAPLSEPVIGIGFGPAGRLVAITRGGTAAVWNLDAPDDRPTTVDLDLRDVALVAFDATGEWAAATASGEIVLLRVPSGAAPGETIRVPIEGSVRAVALSSGAQWYAVGRDDGSVHVAPVEALWTEPGE